MHTRTLGIVAAIGVLTACGSAPPATMQTDAGIVLADTNVACANHIPDPNNPADPDPGTTRGSAFEDFTLQQCDGTPFQFYGDSYCSPTHRLTVVSIAAGWCHPCQQESDLLTDNIVNRFGPMGVRVVQVIVQDENYNPPTLAFCDFWVGAHGLSVHPDANGRGNYELIDPSNVTGRYFPANSLPSTLVIDSDGIIRFRENGATPDLVSLTTELEALLGT